MEQQNVGLEAPKFLCIPVRPLVSFFAVLSVMRGVAFIISEESWLPRIPQFLFIILNILILYGATQNNEFSLRRALQIGIVNLVVVTVQFLIWPVCFASYTASDIGNHSFMDLNQNGTSPESLFIAGLISGYLLELGLALLLGVNMLKYILVRRLWLFSKITAHVPGAQYMYSISCFHKVLTISFKSEKKS